ncbi:MAG TPA: hypothetical protein VJ553_00385 [Candidatus Paceibacterota bacterium]|nr:hypothetical protein [Candidatus Paceibacterota bacterium]
MGKYIAHAVVDITYLSLLVLVVLRIWAPQYIEYDYCIGSASVLWGLMTVHGQIIARADKS